MQVYVKGKDTPWTYVSNYVEKTWLRTPADLDASRWVFTKRGGDATVEVVADHQFGGFGVITGDIRPGVNRYGEPIGS